MGLSFGKYSSASMGDHCQMSLQISRWFCLALGWQIERKNAFGSAYLLRRRLFLLPIEYGDK